MPKFAIDFLPNGFEVTKSLVSVIPRQFADDKSNLYYECMCWYLTGLGVNLTFQVPKASSPLIRILLPDDKIPLPNSLTSSSGQ